ncbi:D-Ala-D-Ala carboxypeptidase family metallohydrolase [Halodesulfovibrio aestuarii]|uniref:Peptidase M15 n=1 Tax=Halodesulfovibrio aestuarii TaxID=126333 RepID=A0A8G2FGP0_9BACT|nr:D-Ala-D-Ala carboxypeptidase family metallohydrolase [Halodesulfovibrio aestuarii]SHI60352.1 Peptidase M15 [Halodesulfovibrio aestuarii]
MQRFLLSPNFYLDEFCRSQTAERMGRPIIVEPGAEIQENLQHLCVTLVQPLRDELGVPIIVTSGYRPEWLNEYIGGSPTSDHIKGLAGDLIVPGLPPLQVAQTIVRLNLPFKQVIHEYGSWVHASVPCIGDAPLRQQLTITRGCNRQLVRAGLLPVT